jgi:hypothetical protein
MEIERRIMSKSMRCEYCARPIKYSPVKKVLKGREHTYCSEFCFRLHFYSVPAISYDDLQKMYQMYCVSLPAPDYYRTLRVLTGGEEKA